MKKTVVVSVSDSRFDVYIGRKAGLKVRGQVDWGNPFKLQSDTGANRTAAIAAYKRHLWAQIQSEEITVEQLAKLHGKRLGCHCAPKACHGDVLVSAAAWAHAQLNKEPNS
jgi:hypothetical protein